MPVVVGWVGVINFGWGHPQNFSILRGPISHPVAIRAPDCVLFIYKFHLIFIFKDSHVKNPLNFGKNFYVYAPNFILHKSPKIRIIYGVCSNKKRRIKWVVDCFE